MLPSTLVGLLLFILLLTPGFAYVLRTERTVPSRQFTTFRETMRVVVASIFCLASTGVIFAIVQLLTSGVTPDVAQLIRAPARYVRQEFIQIAWWSLSALGIATFIGVMIADPRLATQLRSAGHHRTLRWLTGFSDTDIRMRSAWDLVFNMHADQPGRIRVGAQMDDGSYISGYLRHFSVDPEDTADRDLVLQAPLQLTTCAHETLNLSYNYCILSARRFVRLDVQHLAPVEAAAEPREQAPAKMCLTSSRSGSNFGRRPSTRVGPEDHAG